MDVQEMPAEPAAAVIVEDKKPIDEIVDDVKVNGSSDTHVPECKETNGEVDTHVPESQEPAADTETKEVVNKSSDPDDAAKPADVDAEATDELQEKADAEAEAAPGEEGQADAAETLEATPEESAAADEALPASEKANDAGDADPAAAEAELPETKNEVEPAELDESDVTEAAQEAEETDEKKENGDAEAILEVPVKKDAEKPEETVPVEDEEENKGAEDAADAGAEKRTLEGLLLADKTAAVVPADADEAAAVVAEANGADKVDGAPENGDAAEKLVLAAKELDANDEAAKNVEEDDKKELDNGDGKVDTDAKTQEEKNEAVQDDTPVKPRSNNILGKLKRSMSKVKKAITGKSPGAKNEPPPAECQQEIKAK